MFDIEGGDAAYTFLTKHGCLTEKAHLVRQAIELHASVEAVDKRPEIALVHLGVMVDAGFRTDLLTNEAINEIIEAYPRMGINQAMIEFFTYQVQKKDDKRLIPMIEAVKHHSHFEY
ncbi:hypothetical protein ACNRWW_05480 [Metabacillus sp. HB246100]